MDKLTRELYFDHDMDKDKGPSINSDDLEERITARRLRIAERVASMRPDYFNEKAFNEEKAALAVTSNPLADAQVSLSLQRIVNLCRNGNAFITNLKVACDARENLRRVEEDELTNARRRTLEVERKATEKLFEDVEEKWEEAETTQGAHELHDLLEELKTSCARIIDEKNKLIYDMHLELKAKDDHFVKELKKRIEDVDIMVERMESQMKSMQRAYDFELKEIEKAFLEDRENLLREQTNDWEDFMAELRKKQENYLEERKSRISELEELIQRLRTNHSEEFNALKFRLSTEVQNMETDLQQMKATYQLNLEKLEYNFQVLKRRDEENTLTRSQQKRKITQMQDQLNRLRVYSRKQEEALRHENEDMSMEYRKMMEAFRELQRKSRTLIKFEEQNFRDVWIMNEEELRKDAKKLMEADKVIMEQHSFMNNKGPISLAERKRRNTSLAAWALKIPTSTNQSVVNRKSMRCRLPQTLKEASREVVDKFLTLLAFEPEFLIETKMKNVLRSLSYEDQKLIRLDAVLTVLQINSEEMLDKLFTYFILPCDGSRPPTVTVSSPLQVMSTQSRDVKDTITRCESEGAPPTENIPFSEATAFNEEVVLATVYLIDPVDVPRVLHRFLVENCAHSAATAVIESAIDNNRTTTRTDNITQDAITDNGRAKSPQRVSARQQDLLDMKMDEEHWLKYLNTFAPEEKRRMWSGLKRTLQHYLKILKARSRLIVENEALRNQNFELRHLLQLYTKSQAINSSDMDRLPTMRL